MLKNIAKIILIILMIAPIGTAYSCKEQANDDVSMQSTTSVTILAKGQYINDSRHYKPSGSWC